MGLGGGLAVIENEYLPCARLWRGILHRGFDDLNALVHGLEVQKGDDGLLDESDKIRLLNETLDWFFSDRPSPCSLDVVCQALGLTVEKQRARAQKIVDGEGGRMRRQKLKPDQIEEIRLALDSGRTTKQIAAHFKVDVGTVRKVRIRLRRQAAA